MSLWSPGCMRSREKLNYYFPLEDMACKPWRVLTYGETKPIMKPHGSDHVILKDHVSNRKLNISTLEGLYQLTWQGVEVWLQKATHGVIWLIRHPWIIQSCKIYNILSPLLQSLWSLILEVEGAPSIKPSDYWIRSSHDKIKGQNWKLLCLQ